jgi:uncharacterized protein (DUF2384 family)
MRTIVANAAATHIDSENRVLSEAVGRVAACWKLTNEQLGAILGLSSATISRMRSGGFMLDRSNKAFELSQYLVRLFRSLDALMGSDDEGSISWLKAHNLDLDGRPIDLIRTVRGLGEVANYLDDYRANV